MNHMEHDFRIFRDSSELARALAAHVLRAAADAAADRGRFTLALSGGSALARLAEGILSCTPRTSVDWSAWHVFWADERCVSPDSADSNSATARKAWLDHVPIPSGQIHAVDGNLSPPDAARDYEMRIAKAFGFAKGAWPRFDLMLLGMGADGHTASLFPGYPAVEETERCVAPVLDAPKPPPGRVSLTLPVINQARQVCFVVAGGDKAPVLARILQGPAAADAPVPAEQVRLSAGVVHWFIDEQAAGAMKSKGIP
jgi:6-phosphogluconolactonase